MAKASHESKPLAVCAIDFGTSLTGIAYSFASDYKSISVLTKCTNITYGEKIPTVVLLNKEKSFWKFGYEAEEEYRQICDEGKAGDYYYFDCFKMKLYEEKAGIPSKHLILCLEPEAASLWCHNLNSNKVASNNGNTEFRPFPEGQKYMVVDLGGGTADISVHEILPGRNLREIKRADGGAFGGNLIDDAFLRFIADIFGIDVLTLIKKTNYGEIMGLKRNFLIKKHMFKPVSEGKPEKYNIELPVTELKKAIKELEFSCSLEEKMNQAEKNYNGKIKFLNRRKLIIDGSVMEGFFEKATKEVVKILSDIRKDDEVGDINIAMLVGGLSSSPYIQKKIKDNIPGLRIFVPNEPSLAVLKGAVLMGHKPKTITEKIARYSYGLSILSTFHEGEHPEKFRQFQKGRYMCSHIFKKLVEKGAIYKPGDEFGKTILCQIPKSEHEKTGRVVTSIYRSEEVNPKYADEEYGCEIGATIVMPAPPGGWPGFTKFVPKMVLGLSEMTVNVYGSNNETYEAKLEFL
ncbi:heat shock 70 kDa protein 12B-like isoform X2 [Ruditapes philippinarum]|uniref:heat shock 70 kDa protein 12B-like isoform X2 n=1 Tax=Ruditapes philippinarum TaxID=129788 RepID=UPI00295B7918|nr:heat shock 70 kDa protein 12B-like isoform X2 [Ruditapes philippinarum]